MLPPRLRDQRVPYIITVTFHRHRIRRTHDMSKIDREYEARMDALSVKERVARSMTMLKWTRDMIARQIVAESGPMSDGRLKWEVALRLYGSDRITRDLIERKLADVSR